MSNKKALQEQLEAIQGQLRSLTEQLKASKRKELLSSYEQLFLLLYGITIGLVAGAYGNLWATVFYEHIIKEDASLVMHFWFLSVSFIAIALILGIMLIHYYFKMKGTA